ncbi:PREDICTED: uncharacterized protein LOC105119189 isoform X1 [Populus euphratica]|uniref:Uncharacterized protein LOC105119189 isoform X1 n=1 Tax=Populus euphratica TaxID=75702 RepID=A0AAJ6TRH7_POPEU|nr:PREDICTED: uncharacterized protein LOC105119189 isoform X1 [Populus euphratica]
MEDGVTIAESLLHLEEEEDGDKKANLRESGEDRPSGSLLNHVFSNLVSRGEADHEEKGVKEENGEKRGGLLDNIISNLVSPSSNKEQHEVSQARDGGGTTEDQAQKKQKVTVVDEESEKVKAEEEGGGESEKVKAEEEGGGGVIHHIVSHFLTSLPDDAAPTTDEATILIHSIIHD